MDAKKIIFWIVTGLLCLMMLGSAGMYIVNHESVRMIFESLHYPAYIIYPLAIAKILGVIAIVSNYSRSLKEWAYAGFFSTFCWRRRRIITKVSEAQFRHLPRSFF